MVGADTIIVGGGLVGLSIAYGLVRQGADVLILDAGETGFHASRANFGLVWTQTKGLQVRAYATLSRLSAELWPQFAADLQAETGIELGLQQGGGVKLFDDEREMASHAAMLRRQFDQDLPVPGAYEIWDGDEARRRLPALGPKIVGAAFCRLDGAVDPLRLYRALQTGLVPKRARLVCNSPVHALRGNDREIEVVAGPELYRATKVVLAAGLENAKLGALVDLDVPVYPVRGQILVTQRMRRFLELPTHIIRQTPDDTVIIGDSKEDAGYDDRSDAGIMGDIAARAVRAFPCLAEASVVRSWAGLRIMTPDGAPIYARSTRLPGVHAASCHSGVTLAPVHAGPIADWVAGARSQNLAPFSPERFRAQAA
jgi:glycine/D-amino acid oxidase-like deaminating enzyme